MKNERGAITLVTLATVMFIVAFLLSSYMIIANRLQSQAEIKRETTELYEKDVRNVDQIYEDYFASATEPIPVINAEQLLSIGTNKQIAINGKIYTYTGDKNYILKNNIEIDVDTYKSEYADQFADYTIGENTVETWIGINGLRSNNLLTGTFTVETGENFEIMVIPTDSDAIYYNQSNNFSN